MSRQFHRLVRCFELIEISSHTLQQRFDDARENGHTSDLWGFVPVKPILDSISITKQRIRQLEALIKVGRNVARGKNQPYAAWQGMHYMQNISDSRAKPEPLDNDLYHGIHWTILGNLLSACHDSWAARRREVGGHRK